MGKCERKLIRSRAREVKEMNLECLELFKEEVRILENVLVAKAFKELIIGFRYGFL